MNNIDIKFIEFYIDKKYDLKLEEYFKVTSPIVSNWRNKKFPIRRLDEFFYREGSRDVSELIKNIY
jgi:uncharacterized ubiquitin-like protein YukD